jgi:two-component system, chemotaxis family, CheB/CheR fusion protein
MHVVGIGASAGGITALQSLFCSLRSRPNLTFVVIQHLGRGKPSRLVQLLSQWATLPVHQAIDGERPKRGHVYVANPDDVLMLDRGVFRTRSAEGAQRRAGLDTIDAFFESLAQECGSQAIGVVLSGSGADGASGALCIKRSGGVVIVQDPLTAMHNSMPRAAIAHGAADYVLPLGEIMQQLLRCASPAYVRAESSASQAADLTRILDGILELVRKQAGFDLSGYKPTPLFWRLQKRMDVRRVARFEDYEALLRDDPAELEAFVRGIPIHVTEFFRDPPAWDALGKEVIDLLIGNSKPGEPIRTWTPGCATGEEAYSVAMLLSERLEISGKVRDFQAFASDASPEIIARAARGTFSEEALRRVPEQRRKPFFYEADGVYRIKRSLREKMVFATQDLLADPPFSKVDLVTCRNLLIYLEPAAIQRALFMLHSSLRPGGYLFLGTGEAISPRQKGFAPVSTRWHIYRKKGPFSEITFKFPRRPRSAPCKTAVQASAHRTAVELFRLPSVLIDENFEILRVYGDTERLLRLPPGQPTHNLLDLVQPSVIGQLRMAVKEVLAAGRPVIVSGTPDRQTGRGVTIRLTQMETAKAEAAARLLVSFIREQGGLQEDLNEHAAAAHSQRPTPKEWSEAMRLSHEELEASREELQALNEELDAANGQLNVANEELSDANAQLQAKVAELEMQSRVLSSGDVATLFIDELLRVRWFTPAVSELFPLKPEDAGRCITDLAQRFDSEAFIDAVHQVMQTGTPYEAEVRNVDARWFLVRIRPYLPVQNQAAGVAITFTDITERRNSENELRRTEAFVAAQKEAFQAAVNGAPLEKSLGKLVRAAIEQMGEGVRSAFYLADGAGLALHQVTGMPEDYALCVDGFKVGPESLACGLAMDTGRPVITPDVTREPRWKDWLPLGVDFEFRGCWSFPVETTAGKVIGTFAMYHRDPRDATPRDVELATLLTRAAALIISRYQEAEKRARAEAAFRESRGKLTRELEEAQARLRAVNGEG